MKKTILLLAGLIFGFTASAQDTITMLQYNLLNYGNNTSYCTSGNNNISNKDNYIATIVHYINPDIFTVNEMAGSPAIQQRLLDRALNTDGITRYRKADYTPPGDYLVNMLYYNSEKLRYYGHVTAQTYIRDIDIFKLYYFSDDLSKGDTVFLNCIVAHLKAGSGTDNSNKRKVMAQNLMNYLSNHKDQSNYMLMGDFNVYTDEEPAMLQFLYNTDEDIRFYDPVDRMGPWNNNYAYADVHTQSTHSQSNGCASGGGMDDRFDFILISKDIKNKLHHAKYITGTYHAVGQDGNHFNKSINDSPANNSVPSDVLNALYHNSDHLPVTMKLLVDKTLGIDRWERSVFSDVRFKNPVDNRLKLTVSSAGNSSLTVDILSITGQTVFETRSTVPKGTVHMEFPIPELPAGLYILKLTDDKNNSVTEKMVKN